MTWLGLAISLIAALGAGGLLGAHFNWKIEQERALRKRREELVADWRLLIANTVKEARKNNHTVLVYLESQTAYYSLKPHLKKPLCSGAITLKTVDTGVPESQLPASIHTLISEVARIEQEWKLI